MLIHLKFILTAILSYAKAPAVVLSVIKKNVWEGKGRWQKIVA